MKLNVPESEATKVTTGCSHTTHIWPRIGAHARSLARCKCWFYRGRKTREHKENPSKHVRDQQFYSHKFEVRQPRRNYLYILQWRTSLVSSAAHSLGVQTDEVGRTRIKLFTTSCNIDYMEEHCTLKSTVWPVNTIYELIVVVICLRLLDMYIFPAVGHLLFPWHHYKVVCSFSCGKYCYRSVVFPPLSNADSIKLLCHTSSIQLARLLLYFLHRLPETFSVLSSSPCSWNMKFK